MRNFGLKPRHYIGRDYRPRKLDGVDWALIGFQITVGLIAGLVLAVVLIAIATV